MRTQTLGASMAVAALMTTTPVLADTIEVLRHGVSCTSPDALAKLTRPDGSSLVDGNHPTREAMQVATQGGCVNLKIGQTFDATSVRKNTSVVLGPNSQPVYFPNTDLKITRTSVRTADGIVGQTNSGEVNANTGGSKNTKAADLPLVPSNSSSQQAFVEGSFRPESREPKRLSELSTGLLALDMNTDKARSNLASDYDFYDAPEASHGAAITFNAVKRDRTEQYEVSSINGKVYFIKHFYKFDQGKEAILADLIARVEVKYGSKSSIINPKAQQSVGEVMPVRPDWQQYWQYDESGLQIVPDADLSRRLGFHRFNDILTLVIYCADYLARAYSPQDSPTNGLLFRSAQPPVHGGLNGLSCGREAFVQMQSGSLWQLAGGMLVMLADFRPVESMANTKQAAVAAAAAAKLKAASTNQPPL